MMKPVKTILLPALLLLSAVAGAQSPKYGQDAMEVTLPNVNGDTLRLSSLKGKVVLLDFWASWCVPCRSANKELVRIYPKYKNKGFEIFSISLDDDKEKWQEAIKKDKITWLQVRDSGGFDASTAIQWRIDAIPTTYLIDKTGKLIATDLEGKQLIKVLKKLLDD